MQRWKVHQLLKKIIFLLFVLFAFNIYSQEVVLKGRVLDENRNPITGANVFLYGTASGCAADKKGYFLLEKVPTGKYTLQISMIGYQPYRKELSLPEGGEVNLSDIQLLPSPVAGEMVVVTASKYQQALQDIPTSMSLINKREIIARNIITLDKALQYVPGVNMNADQINIRGSSGYSMGVGSRVLFLLDGVPFLTGDTREINFDVLPGYMIQRIEVMKGAGSALYGSSALGGVVNFISNDISQSPPIYVKLYGGLFNKTAYEEWNWSDRRRYFRGASFQLSQHNDKIRIQVGGALDSDDSYRQNDIRNRYSGSGKLQWIISPRQEVTFTGNYMYQKRENFLYWRSLKYALQPPIEQLDDQVESTRYFVTTRYRYIFGSNTFLTFRGIWFWNRFIDSVSSAGGNRSTSGNLNGEIQFNTKLNNILLTTGIEGVGNKVKSNIFGTHTGEGFAAYMQSEYTLGTHWGMTAGIRLDYFDIDSVDAYQQVNPKLGIVYRPHVGTALRTSIGLGYRAPSLAEIFTSTDASGFQVIPNLQLKAEKSRYFEIGWNQFYGKRILTDISYFYSRYFDLIEGEFLQSGEIQFQNITNARIMGTEITLTSELIPKRLNLLVGYSYIDPVDLDNLKFLKFRPRHLIHNAIGIITSRFDMGIDYRFIKKYDQIDEKFLLIINDAEKRVDAHIFDFRISSKVRIGSIPTRISLLINNLFQYYSVDLVGSLAPIRHFTLTIETAY
jgi:outer membrane receptor for ferrienterochelin and colicins